MNNVNTQEFALDINEIDLGDDMYEHFCPNPNCGIQIGGYDDKNEDGSDPFFGIPYCPWCGQALSWTNAHESDRN